MSTAYGHQFFVDQQGAMRSARRVLPVVLDAVQPTRVIDVGCGIGAWARAARDLGCSVRGLDGTWVPRDQMLIDSSEFAAVDLASPPEWPDTYDLAMSLEVAEHLPESAAGRFVKFLCGLAPYVLFSAAVPCQRGTGHVNEQYPSYWATHFRHNGFEVVDFIRAKCWNDQEIEFYYRQNVVMFAERGRVSALARHATAPPPLDVIHPDAIPILAQGWLESLGTVRSAGLLRRSLARSIRKRLGRQR